MSPGRLAGKTVVITGASSGIGAACAVEFARHDARLVLVARRLANLEQVAAQVRAGAAAAQVACVQLDVTDEARVKEALTKLPPGFGGGVDVLVNNAGLVKGVDHLADVSSADVDAMINCNVKGVVHCTQAVLPFMKAQGAGHIINVSSIAGIEAYPGGSIYAGTKHFLNAMTQSLRMELVGSGIKVCSVSPGLVETEFSVVRYRGDEAKAKSVYSTLSSPPLNASDVAEAIVFAATRAPHVTIADVLILPSCQASAKVVSRVK